MNKVHFDIAEFFLRKILKTLSTTNFSDNYEREIGAIIAKGRRERKAMQGLYDFETRHSANSKRQAVWEEEMSKLLAQ